MTTEVLVSERWWYHKVNAELKDYSEKIEVEPVVRTGGRIAHGEQIAGSGTRCSGLLGILLALISLGVVYYQSQINKIWDVYGNPIPGTPVPQMAT